MLGGYSGPTSTSRTPLLRQLAKLLVEGLLLSDTPKGKVRAGFSVHAFGSLLPNLYPAGDVDMMLEQMKQVASAATRGK